MTILKRIKVCYFCGNPADGKEHVPPRMMFKAFRCSSITVPACATHNNDKSGTDQAIVFGLLLNFGSPDQKYPLEPEVDLAYKTAAKDFPQLKKRVSLRPIMKERPATWVTNPSATYIGPGINRTAWIRELTAALMYDAVGEYVPEIKWSKAKVWSPDWWPGQPEGFDLQQAQTLVSAQMKILAAALTLNWIEGWSATPERYPRVIYNFKISFDIPREIHFCHQFYNRYLYYIGFPAPKRVIIAVRQKTVSAKT